MRRFLPSISCLRSFDASVRSLSFTKAAEELCITQSAVSRQVTALETFLGIKLFERIGPKLILTELGRHYYEQISGPMSQLELASIEAVRGRTSASFIQIAMPPTLQRRWGIPLLAEFSHDYPEHLYELSSCRNGVEQDAPEVDFFFMRALGQPAGCRPQKLFDETLVVVGAPSLLPQDRMLSDEEFAGFKLLQNMSRPSLWMKWLSLTKVKRQGPIAGPRFEVTDTLISAAEAAIGLAIVPEFLVRQELAKGTLRLAFDICIPSGEYIYLCRPEARERRSHANLFHSWITSKMAA